MTLLSQNSSLLAQPRLEARELAVCKVGASWVSSLYSWRLVGLES